jgi:hypothetical protein
MNTNPQENTMSDTTAEDIQVETEKFWPLVEKALEDYKQVEDNPEYGGTVVDMITDTLIAGGARVLG